MEESVIAREDTVGDTKSDCQYPKKFRTSVSRSSCSGHPTLDGLTNDNIQLSGQGAERTATSQGPIPPSQQSIKASRPFLPPLQPLSITRRCLEEWPEAGFDDIGDWLYFTSPRGKTDSRKLLNGPDIRLDLGSLQKNVEPTELKMKRNKFAFFDKECSMIAEHIYLGGDVVAKNREVLQQNGITHVLNCVGYHCQEYFKKDMIYKTLWLQDNPAEDITSILYDVFDYFEDVREQSGRVFVHCCRGVSRSSSLVIAYLMWRKGQSFEDAFQYVKAIRGIADPNIGFVSQLLQWHKKVQATPSSFLRMYRMAPHSSYAPLHLVPKSVNPIGTKGLDSRGAFIVHIPSAIYVWIGNRCNPVMKRMAKTAASQVARYERAQGPILVIEEGHENNEFWNALSKPAHLSDQYDNAESNTSEEMPESFCSDKDRVDAVCVGNKMVESYNLDFELFGRAIAGGVMPLFSISGAEAETHLPARETGCGILQRKLASGSTKGLVTASKERGVIELLSPRPLKSSFSPYLSPTSIFSDSALSSSSTLSFTPSPTSSVWSPFSSSQSPSPVSNLWEPFVRSNTSSEIITEPCCFPSKDESSSVRRCAKKMHSVLYNWPHMEKFDIFNANDLDHRAVFILLEHGISSENLKFATAIYLWVGSDLKVDSIIGRTQTTEGDWERIGRDFLHIIDLPRDIPIKVVRDGEESEEFWRSFING